MNINDLKDGDLLFMSDSSEMSLNIQKSTGKFSHVAIYFSPYIFHASFKYGVVKQSPGDFFSEEKRIVFVYRYSLINLKKVKAEAEKYLGLPYNYSFLPDDKGFYCSEYIATILPIFETVPMKFSDEKNEVSPFWKEYYEKLDIKVPLNVEGTNPTQLSECKELKFMGKLEN